MRVTIIGAGYVGLVSGVCFADFGHDVVCVDNDATKVEALRAGKVPIFEPDLDRLIASNMRDKRLSFTTDVASAVAGAEVVFIAVGTPSRRGDGHADLSYVYAAAREIAGVLPERAVVVTKSTVPVGTGDEVERIIREENPAATVTVVSNPEFLREGAAIRDFKHPDRIVIGTDDARARGVMAEVYRPLHLNASPILYGSPHRRADEVRRQLLPCHQDRFHQRDRRSRRKGRRQCPGGRARDRPRQPDRSEIPARGARLRRILFSEGCNGADQDRAGQ